MSEAAGRPRFLRREEVLALHDWSLLKYGGERGVRDLGLLDSAIAQPRQTSGGAYLHAFPQEMSAAYGFHIARNHPFFDGNKRTAWLALQMFLELNDFHLCVPAKDAVETMLGVASGTFGKANLVEWIASHLTAAPNAKTP